MILRVIRGRVAQGRESDFVDLCRQTTADRARSPGLVAFIGGYRRVDGADHFLLASSWQSAQDAERSAGPPEKPTVASVLADVAQIDSFDVYDALEPTYRGIVDAPGGVVRVTTAFVKQGQRDALFAWLGQSRQVTAVQRLVLGWAMGERTVDGRELLVAVSAWPSPLVLESLVEPGQSSAMLFEAAQDFVTDVSVEQYQAIGLDLPDYLSDIGSRRVLAARFESREMADAAALQLSRDISSASETPISVALLGNPGTAAHVRNWILVVRVTLSDYPRAERLVVDHGGEVILTTREPGPAGGNAGSSEPAASGPLTEGPGPAWSAAPAN